MALENKLGITDSAELAREEERLSKAKALRLFEEGRLDCIEAGTFQINDRGVYMKGIDASYHYEGYNAFRTEDI